MLKAFDRARPPSAKRSGGTNWNENMKKTISSTVVFLLSFLGSCAKNTDGNYNSYASEQPNVVVISQPAVVTLQQFVWPSSEFQLKFPCGIDEDKTAEKGEEIAASVTRTQICQVGNIKFSVSSKKYREGTVVEFEKLKKEKNVEEKSINGFRAIDFEDSKTTFQTKTTGASGEVNESWTETVRNRLYLADDHRLIEFGMTCVTDFSNYCEDLHQPIGEEFFDSLKLSK